MPTHKRHFAPGDLQFLTSSTYHRAKLFESDRFRWSFVEVLGQLRPSNGRGRASGSTPSMIRRF
jgi:hypothetical protein